MRRIFITHQQTDHIGGLEELALANTYMHFDPQTAKGFKPQIISSINVLVNLWDTSLKGGLGSIQGRHALLQDYFFIFSLKYNNRKHDSFSLLKRYRFDIFPTDHILIERKYDWPSYGLLMTDTQTDETVFFSGDSRFAFDAYGAAMTAATMVLKLPWRSEPLVLTFIIINAVVAVFYCRALGRRMRFLQHANH